MEYRTLEEWPFDAAQADQDKYSGDAPLYRQPLMIFLAFRGLEDSEAHYLKTQSGRTILKAMGDCAHYGIVIPDWLAKAYFSRYNLVAHFKVDSWDDAFDKPFPKGTHLNALRKKQSIEMRVYNNVKDMLRQNPSLAIGKELFEAAGKPLGVGATLADKYYYSVVRWLSTEMAAKPQRRLIKPRIKSRK